MDSPFTIMRVITTCGLLVLGTQASPIAAEPGTTTLTETNKMFAAVLANWRQRWTNSGDSLQLIAPQVAIATGEKPSKAARLRDADAGLLRAHVFAWLTNTVLTATNATVEIETSTYEPPFGYASSLVEKVALIQTNDAWSVASTTVTLIADGDPGYHDTNNVPCCPPFTSFPLFDLPSPALSEWWIKNGKPNLRQRLGAQQHAE